MSPVKSKLNMPSELYKKKIKKKKIIGQYYLGPVWLQSTTDYALSYNGLIFKVYEVLNLRD